MKTKSLFILALTISVLGLTGCKSSDEEVKTETKKYVKIETVKNGTGNAEMVFNGNIKEKSLVDLSFRVGGPLRSLNVIPGDFVKEGQIIATIDKRDYKIQLQTTKAQYEQVKGEYERYKELFEEDKIPANSFEKAESGYLMTKAAYENAQNQFNDCELKAPFSGYIFEKKAENFQTVGPGQPIASLIDKSTFEVVIGVPEKQINKIKNNTHNYVAVKNANVSSLPVKIISIGEKTRPDGLFEVKLSFKNTSDLNVAPGMSAEVTMKCYNDSNTLSIPISAVFPNNNSNYVWMYDQNSGTIKKKKVKIRGLASGGRIEIMNGVAAGDSIVTTGVSYLSEGQKVEPIKAPTKTNIGGLL